MTYFNQEAVYRRVRSRSANNPAERLAQNAAKHFKYSPYFIRYCDKLLSSPRAFFSILFASLLLPLSWGAQFDHSSSSKNRDLRYFQLLDSMLMVFSVSTLVYTSLFVIYQKFKRNGVGDGLGFDHYLERYASATEVTFKSGLSFKEQMDLLTTNRDKATFANAHLSMMFFLSERGEFRSASRIAKGLNAKYFYYPDLIKVFVNFLKKISIGSGIEIHARDASVQCEHGREILEDPDNIDDVVLDLSDDDPLHRKIVSNIVGQIIDSGGFTDLLSALLGKYKPDDGRFKFFSAIALQEIFVSDRNVGDEDMKSLFELLSGNVPTFSAILRMIQASQGGNVIRSYGASKEMLLYLIKYLLASWSDVADRSAAFNHKCNELMGDRGHPDSFFRTLFYFDVSIAAEVRNNQSVLYAMLSYEALRSIVLFYCSDREVQRHVMGGVSQLVNRIIQFSLDKLGPYGNASETPGFYLRVYAIVIDVLLSCEKSAHVISYTSCKRIFDHIASHSSYRGWFQIIEAMISSMAIFPDFKISFFSLSSRLMRLSFSVSSDAYVDENTKALFDDCIRHISSHHSLTEVLLSDEVDFISLILDSVLVLKINSLIDGFVIYLKSLQPAHVLSSIGVYLRYVTAEYLPLFNEILKDDKEAFERLFAVFYYATKSHFFRPGEPGFELGARIRSSKHKLLVSHLTHPSTGIRVDDNTPFVKQLNKFSSTFGHLERTLAIRLKPLKIKHDDSASVVKLVS